MFSVCTVPERAAPPSRPARTSSSISGGILSSAWLSTTITTGERVVAAEVTPLLGGIVGMGFYFEHWRAYKARTARGVFGFHAPAHVVAPAQPGEDFVVGKLRRPSPRGAPLGEQLLDPAEPDLGPRHYQPGEAYRGCRSTRRSPLASVPFELDAGILGKARPAAACMVLKIPLGTMQPEQHPRQGLADPLVDHPFKAVGNFLIPIDQRQIHGQELDLSQSLSISR